MGSAEMDDDHAEFEYSDKGFMEHMYRSCLVVCFTFVLALIGHPN